MYNVYYHSMYKHDTDGTGNYFELANYWVSYKAKSRFCLLVCADKLIE